MRTICAWCKAVIREATDPTSKDVSHGICKSCAAVHFPEKSQGVQAAA
jgi:hypothetical protein